MPEVANTTTAANMGKTAEIGMLLVGAAFATSGIAYLQSYYSPVYKHGQFKAKNVSASKYCALSDEGKATDITAKQ
eukprot:CAMPEP_0173383012 /NCGR_PEP_ID=MMETSP1356-20130122/5537_1 /TAXON_ID=77927 ORGANISM="Hemiselmis virescens, Strain PCC157" /NCGR_SAMPLE_ID=MMETSP1356 /ASSEMBLY_ACC=CAM_ASM_000847 /LENGTH=75 /DNA_ID=CAMNT_0014337653 /DNA_START=14 /DNA_END=241 /DNA_ORIENTATION=-